MITPVLLANTGTNGWGTYLFFAALNAIFFPIIYFLYPETAGRTLEEIDVIFAKGYAEKISYVKAAQDLPRLNETEVQQKAREYGFSLSDEEAQVSMHEKVQEGESSSSPSD